MRQLLQLSIYTGILCLGLAIPGLAQNNPAVLYGSHFHREAARLNPAKLGDTYTNFDITGIPMPLPTFNLYAWAGNNRLNAKDFQKYFVDGGNTIDSLTIEEFIGRFKNKNIIGAGLQAQVFGFSFKINRKTEVMDMNNPDLADIPVIKRDEIVTISFDILERMAISTRIPKELAAFAWRGNGSPEFLGREVDLGNLTTNGYWLREFALGAAMPIYQGLDLKVRAGVRLKYLQGMAAIRSKRAKFTVLTQDPTQGGNISVNADYLVNISSPFEVDTAGNFIEMENPNAAPLFRAQGSGFGIDLGTTVTIQDRFVGTFSLLDLGAVGFRRNVVNYSLNASEQFSGVTIPGDFSDANFEGANGILDSLTANFEPQNSFNRFSIPLPTRLMLQAEYKVPRVDKKGRKFDKHHFYLTYIQGFGEYGISTARPSFTAAYSHNLGQQMNFGFSATSGGYSGFGLGSFVSFKIGYYRFGLGTNNLTALLFRSGGTGVDFSFNLSTAFR
ncbi:MAG TPA: hypothetical protein DCS93_14240 [Microscillaceae bacterium]|nr:hypothetical protein [Microscillaceae bacterium]